MSIELRRISSLLQKVKSKEPKSLRERVLSRQMLMDISDVYPLTFASIMCPDINKKQVNFILHTNPNARKELCIYQSKLQFIY